MVQGVPYVHWKIKDAVDLSEIDPVYLWGTVVETDKGPIDQPVFCTNADQVKKIFNYNLEPFFANGGRSVVIVRAYGGQPQYGKFNFTLDEDFSYIYVDYDYYMAGDKGVKATVLVDNPDAEKPRPILNNKIYAFTSYNNAAKNIEYGTGTAQATGVVTDGYTQIIVLENSADTPTQAFTGRKFYVDSNAATDGSATTQLFEQPNATSGIDVFVTIQDLSGELQVAFSEGRWRACDENGIIKYFYIENEQIKQAVVLYNDANEKVYCKEGSTIVTDDNVLDPSLVFTKSFNESDVKKVVIAKRAVVPAGASVIELKALYPGDFQVPISVQKDIRSGYRVSIKESDDFTIMLSGATTLDYINKRINERANNIKSALTSEGETVQKPFDSTLVTAIDGNGQPLPVGTEANLPLYTEAVQARGLPVGAVFAKVPESVDDTDEYAFKLSETVTYLADGSNGSWDSKLHRILTKDRVAAHKNALDHLALVKLSGIFCNYGEDDVQKVYAEHVSTTEPEGMNSVEVCKWRSLILGANLIDRTNDKGEEPGFKLIDKAVAFDNENILFLGQGLIDDGFEPQSNVQVEINPITGQPVIDQAGNVKYVSLLNDDEAALEHQLLPFQCTQYIAGLRSKLFYGDAIFGGEAKKEIVGVGNVSIAPLFTGENKVLWQPAVYTDLNEHGVLTLTEDYNILSLMDGVTTRQSPLEEDEEGVQSIVKYAKHAVHEVLQSFIGRNITGDLEAMMENAISTVLNSMVSADQTLIAIPSEGYSAFETDIVLVPKSNAQQTLAKAYVYLKLTPVHALGQIEVELTVQ